MSWRPSRAELIEPCLPSSAKVPPSGPGWVHEIKHDGFRILARRDSVGVRLISRAGNDFSSRFPFIAKAVGKLPVRSCLIDGSDQDRTLPPQNTSLLCTFCGLLATRDGFIHRTAK